MKNKPPKIIQSFPTKDPPPGRVLFQQWFGIELTAARLATAPTEGRAPFFPMEINYCEFGFFKHQFLEIINRNYFYGEF